MAIDDSDLSDLSDTYDDAEDVDELDDGVDAGEDAVMQPSSDEDGDAGADDDDEEMGESGLSLQLDKADAACYCRVQPTTTMTARASVNRASMLSENPRQTSREREKLHRTM